MKVVKAVGPGDIALMRWRIGRKLGRTIYAMPSSAPADDDILIGMMDDRSLAAVAVLNHNECIDRRAGVRVLDALKGEQ